LKKIKTGKEYRTHDANYHKKLTLKIKASKLKSTNWESDISDPLHFQLVS